MVWVFDVRMFMQNNKPEENSGLDFSAPIEKIMPESIGMQKRMTQILILLDQQVHTMFGYMAMSNKIPAYLSSKVPEDEETKIHSEPLPGRDGYGCYCSPASPNYTDNDPSLWVLPDGSPDPSRPTDEMGFGPDPRHYNEEFESLIKRIGSGEITGPIIFSGNGDPEGKYVPSASQFKRLTDAARAKEIPIYFLYIDDPTVDDLFTQGLDHKANDPSSTTREGNTIIKHGSTLDDEEKRRVNHQITLTHRMNQKGWWRGGKYSLWNPDGSPKDLWPENKSHRIYKYQQMCENTGGKLVRVLGSTKQDEIGATSPEGKSHIIMGPKGDFEKRLRRGADDIFAHIHNWDSNPQLREKVKTEPAKEEFADNTISPHLKNKEAKAPAPVKIPETFLEQTLHYHHLDFLDKTLQEIPNINKLADGIFGRTVLAEFGIRALNWEIEHGMPVDDVGQAEFAREAKLVFEKMSKIDASFNKKYDALPDTYSVLDKCIIAFSIAMDENRIRAVDTKNPAERGGVDYCSEAMLKGMSDCDQSGFHFLTYAKEKGLDGDMVICKDASQTPHQEGLVHTPQGDIYLETPYLLYRQHDKAEDLLRSGLLKLTPAQYNKAYQTEGFAYVNKYGTQYEMEYVSLASQIEAKEYLETVEVRNQKDVQMMMQQGMFENDAQANERLRGMNKSAYKRGKTEFSKAWEANKSDFNAYIRYVRYLKMAQNMMQRQKPEIELELDRVLTEGQSLYPGHIFKRQLSDLAVN